MPIPSVYCTFHFQLVRTCCTCVVLFSLLHYSSQSEIINLNRIIGSLGGAGAKVHFEFLCFRFMAENKNKKQAAEKENSGEKEQITVDREQEKSGKTGELFNLSSFGDIKGDKTMPFFEAGEEEFLKSHGMKERDLEEDAEVKPALVARDMFGKWGDESSYSTSYPSIKEKVRVDPEDIDPIDDVEEELYRSRKHKKEEKSKKKEKKEKEKARRSLSPPTTSREKDRPLFPGAFPPREQSPAPRLFASKEDFELRIASLDELPRYVQINYK